MFRATFAALLFLAAPYLTSPALAACDGSNLLDALPADQAGAVQAALDLQPYPAGNYWHATKGDRSLHIIGTYHFPDPRHDLTLATVMPALQAAKTVLVEAGPAEEAQLMDEMGRNPDLLFLNEGPSLKQQMPPQEWQMLADAMKARGIPPFMAAKFKPWYLSVLLAVPPCQIAEMADPIGLDKLVIDAAIAATIPIRALEPYDTVFAIFADLTAAEQIAMIRSTLLLEDRTTDMSITLSDLYFSQDSRRMWEYMRLETQKLPGYTPEKADAEYARMEDILITRRNQAWIPILDAAAADGPAFAAFGALHLAGHDGVLNLLAQAGYRLERLPLP